MINLILHLKAPNGLQTNGFVNTDKSFEDHVSLVRTENHLRAIIDENFIKIGTISFNLRC